ncbi:MAG: type I-B CRISPR-associated protein Cas7/Cst2/DevR [Actinomycetota bacterium]|nr:type I-B CRISPR-associated protein Cas7/Cst2/DevR [Actinomycetota bacterium]
MSFISGLLLIDAPASALNNLGKIDGAMTDNASGVKFIRTREGAYPYVSAQAFRYWLRRTLEQGDWGWKAAPIYREEKIAYTDANPIIYWDDDLFGYMRAPSKKASAVAAREADANSAIETATTETVTRVSPFRVSTLVSIAPVSIVNDFGVMSRHSEGDPVPYEHQFYRTTLQGLISLDLSAAGTFSYRNKTGYLNLDEIRVEIAKNAGLEELSGDKSYRLPVEQRLQRIAALLEALAHLDGGAKQAQHYTDVSPDILVMAVTKGGNNIFGHIVGANSQGKPSFKIDALDQALRVFEDQILSKIYIGWVRGYLDDERSSFEAALSGDGVLKDLVDKNKIIIAHPREALRSLIKELKDNPDWLS